MAGQTAKMLNAFAFGRFVLIPGRRLLLEENGRVRIGRRAFDILQTLVERQGEVVSKRELISRAWPDILVDEGNLKVNIAVLRQILGRESGSTRYIATVAGRGYRFVAPVQITDPGRSLPDLGSSLRYDNNLPAYMKPIFGRSEAIASILRELESCQLVSIVGPGGVGKTTVAVAVAHLAWSTFDAGAWMVDFGLVADQSRVEEAIAATVGLNQNSAKLPDALYDFLRGRKMLLVLDSCEHLVDEIACFADRILASAKNVKLIVTSREPLCVKGERVRRLSGLRAPASSQQLSANEALTFPAIQLFVDRTRAGHRPFELDDTNARTVAEICYRLDGLALAIERVAMRVDAIGIAEMLDHLENRFHILDGYHAGPERHRTLTATVDSSYNLLSMSDQAVMRRLSAFAGAFSLDAACAVAVDDDLDRASVVEGVANLVAKSLLMTQARNGEIEYQQNRIVRVFAREKLINREEFPEVRRRHAKHVLDLVEHAVAVSGAPPRIEGSTHWEAKIDDIRAALSWSFSDSVSASLAVRLVVAAIPFLSHKPMAGECRLAIERALEDRFSSYRNQHDDLMLNLALAKSLLALNELKPTVQSVLMRASKIAAELGETHFQLECLGLLSEHHLLNDATRRFG